MGRTSARAVGSLDDLLDRIRVARDSLGFKPGEECLYRGHPDEKWPLLPTLLRKADERKWRTDKLRDVEADLYWEFQARARAVHSGGELSDWDVLFQMREHGVATRLLDWTETLGVAFWFSMCKPPSDPASRRCIWLLNPYALNDRESGWEIRDLVSPQYLEDYSDAMGDYSVEFEWSTPIALYPVQRNQRLHAQRGYFTIHGERREPLEDQLPGVLTSVPIEKDEEPYVQHLLEIAGIDEHRLFPDLDALARFLHNKYGI